MPDGDGGEAMVHRRMLPGAEQQHHDSGRGGGNGGAAEGAELIVAGNFNVDLKKTSGQG